VIKNKNILLGVSGGIAAYKAVELASLLKKQGANVKVILTQNTREFITPITFKAITHDLVLTNNFDLENEIAHITLADWADIFVIAPATANIIGKIANGIADDLLTSTIMAYTKKTLIVPAMNIHMYENKILQDNIKKLKRFGFYFMEPESGQLACGYQGKGRFPKSDEILYFIKAYLHYEQDLMDKNILVTAGATQQKIDPMRFLTNIASGKMGVEIARAAAIRGAKVTLIHGSVKTTLPEYLHHAIQTLSAEEMYASCLELATKQDLIFKAAAVSDYTPEIYLERKLKKGKDFELKLVRTNDILAELGKRKPENQILVGFAAESENIIENATEKMARKNCDFIVANHLNNAGKDESEVTILSKEKSKQISGDKFMTANQILDFVLYGK
jgi:phosphopantothenoylcysteine decarboxylase/phosphopantothenate--cysteine ligase